MLLSIELLILVVLVLHLLHLLLVLHHGPVITSYLLLWPLLLLHWPHVHHAIPLILIVPLKTIILLLSIVLVIQSHLELSIVGELRCNSMPILLHLLILRRAVTSKILVLVIRLSIVKIAAH